jgi:multipile epidermal growth factor-like domains protein 8
MLILLLTIVGAIVFRPLPSSKTPPTFRRALPAVYNPQDSAIYLFGGATESQEESLVDDLWTFNVTTKTWDQLTISSSVTPSPRMGSHMALYNNTLIVVGGSTEYGPSSDLWTFDIYAHSWHQQWPTGDYFGERSYGSFCTVSWKGTKYLAIYGGFDRFSDKNCLHL